MNPTTEYPQKLTSTVTHEGLERVAPLLVERCAACPLCESCAVIDPRCLAEELDAWQLIQSGFPVGLLPPSLEKQIAERCAACEQVPNQCTLSTRAHCAAKLIHQGEAFAGFATPGGLDDC